MPHLVSPRLSIGRLRALVLVVASLVGVHASAQPARRPAFDSTSLRDLPLVEIPAKGAPDQRSRDVLALFITGDGGWASLDHEVAAVLAEHGIPVVGLDSRAYLGTKRSPDDVGRDVARVLRHYTTAWSRPRFLLVGYSRGADLLPFAASRLPADLRPKLAGLGLLAFATRVGFEFHWQDIVRTVHRPGDQLTLPEIEKLRGMGAPILCVYGESEDESGCRAVAPGLVRAVGRPGKHHFDGDYRRLGALVLELLGVR